MVHLSLDTDSKSIAEKKWRTIGSNQVEAWRTKLAGDTADAEGRHAAAVKLEEVKGFRFFPTIEGVNLRTVAFLQGSKHPRTRTKLLRH